MNLDLLNIPKMAQNRAHNAHEAEDLAQIGYIGALKAKTRYGNHPDILKIACAAARNAMTDELRKMKYRRFKTLREDDTMTEPESDHADLRDQVELWFDALTPEQQKALLACHVRELKRRDAAKLFGWTRGKIDGLLFRATEKIRKLFPR